MEQINTGHWPFDGSITEDVQIEDLTAECLEFANERKISLNGTERVSGVMHYAWQAAENADFAAIDEFIAYVNYHKIPSYVLHEKRPRSHYQTVPADPAEETTPIGRGLTRSKTTEMLMQLEDDQMAFGLEALNKYLGEGVRPGVLTGDVEIKTAQGLHTTKSGADTIATAFPSDIEERRAAFAAETEQEGMQRVVEMFPDGQNFQVICDETNNPPDVVETGDLNVDILLDLNHVSAKLSDMGISWQGGASQNIDSEYARGYAEHILKLRDDHAVDPEPITLIDGKLVAGETKKQNHARVIDLFKHAAKVGIGRRTAIDYAENPKGSQIITAYDVSIRNDEATQIVTRKDLDGSMYVLSTHSISAYDVAKITDKQTRQMQHAETAEFLTEMRKESGRSATITPAHVAALNAQDARRKQKKVKTKTRNKRSR